MNELEKIAERIRQQIVAEAAETKDICSWPIGWAQQVDRVANLMMRGGNIAFVEMQKELEKERAEIRNLKESLLQLQKADVNTLPMQPTGQDPELSLVEAAILNPSYMMPDSVNDGLKDGTLKLAFDVADKGWGAAGCHECSDTDMGSTSHFFSDLSTVINRHCKENGSNTPDFIIAKFLESCLSAFDIAINERTQWSN